MKRTLSLVLCLLMALTCCSFGVAEEQIELTLTGIGFSVESGVNPTTGAPYVGWQEWCDTVLKEAFPNVTIKMENIPWDDFMPKMQTILQSGQTDLLYTSGAFVAKFYESGLLMDLTPFIEDDESFDYDAIYPAGLRHNMNLTDYTTEKTIALPFVLGYRINVYDKEIFDQWGVEYLSDHPTADEVIEKARAMTGINPVTGEMNYGCWFDGKSPNMSTMLEIGYANGVVGCEGELTDLAGLEWSLNTPELVKTVEQVCELAKCCPPDFINSKGNEAFGTTENIVAIGINVSGANIIYNYNQTGDQSLLDRYTAVQGMGPLGEGWAVADGIGMAASIDERKKDIAWEVLKFIAGYEGCKYNYENFGPFCVGLNADVVDFYPEYDEYIRMNAKVTENAHSGLFEETNPFFASDIYPTLMALIGNAAAGQEVDVKGTLEDLQKKAEDWTFMQ